MQSSLPSRSLLPQNNGGKRLCHPVLLSNGSVRCYTENVGEVLSGEIGVTGRVELQILLQILIVYEHLYVKWRKNCAVCIVNAVLTASFQFSIDWIPFILIHRLNAD